MVAAMTAGYALMGCFSPVKIRVSNAMTNLSVSTNQQFESLKQRVM